MIFWNHKHYSNFGYSSFSRCLKPQYKNTGRMSSTLTDSFSDLTPVTACSNLFTTILILRLTCFSVRSSSALTMLWLRCSLTVHSTQMHIWSERQKSSKPFSCWGQIFRSRCPVSSTSLWRLNVADSYGAWCESHSNKPDTSDMTSLLCSADPYRNHTVHHSWSMETGWAHAGAAEAPGSLRGVRYVWVRAEEWRSPGTADSCTHRGGQNGPSRS